MYLNSVPNYRKSRTFPENFGTRSQVRRNKNIFFTSGGHTPLGPIKLSASAYAYVLAAYVHVGVAAAYAHTEIIRLTQPS